MTLKDEKEKFNLIAKRILKVNLSTNPDTLRIYQADIVKAYNTAVKYVNDNFDRQSTATKEAYLGFDKYVRKRFLLCLNNLKLNYAFSREAFELVEENRLIVLEKESNNTYESDNETFEDVRDNDYTRNDNLNRIAMAEEAKSKFINTYSKLIPEFDGTVGNLPRFIDACELVEEDVGTHMATAVKLIKTKLGSVPRSYITTEDTIRKIIDTLRKEVTGESSKTLNAKLMAIRQGNKTPNDFIKEIEDVTKQLKIAYLSEGMPINLAEDHSIESAVRSLIGSVSNSQVKTVFQSADFKSINDVSTKYLSVATEQAASRAQVLSYRKFNRRGNKGRYRGNHNYNSNNSNRGNYQNNSFRGNRGRGNQRGRGNNRGGSNQNQSVRYTENYQYPQLTLGGESSTSST